MPADFWAGYISGAIGIIIGNPLDLIKVRLQAGTAPASSSASVPSATTRPFCSPASLATGAAAPMLGYGALNALLFVSYNRSEAALKQLFPSSAGPTSLYATWLAGALGGLATWAVSTPTELVKCRAQLAPPGSPSSSSWHVARQIWRTEGRIRGFYLGGTVTALRDSVGYGFYFWAYEVCTRWMQQGRRGGGGGGGGGWAASEAAQVLLCGGVAGVVTWASVFPLDVIKTRVQAQIRATLPGAGAGETAPLIGSGAGAKRRKSALEVAREAYREGGIRVFFRGLGVCSVRAFVVNAVQWAAYEWIMKELGQGREVRHDRSGASAVVELV